MERHNNKKTKYFLINLFIFLLLATGHWPLVTVVWGQATQLVIVTNPFTSTETHPSQSVVVEAQDAGNIIDTSFNETVNLSTGSPAGRFSADRIIWQDTDAITLAQGRAVFYYKDGSSCISEGVSITVSRDGLTPATQAETIQFSVPSGPGSYITINQARMSADGASACTVMITVNDTFGFPVAGMQVTIMTGRGEPADTIFQPVSLTDAEGLCAGSIVSENAGIDTITALCEGQVITMGVNLDSAEGIWHFDSSLEDYSGRGYTGTNSGGLWVTDGLSGSAIRYDGVSSYMQCDSSTILNTTITVEAWVKVFNYPSNCAQILGKFPGPWMFTLWSDGTAAAEVEGRVNYLLFADAGITPLPLDSWNHLVSVYVQNGDFKTYLNGSEVQASSPINPLGDDGSIMLRASNNYPPDVEGGALDGIVDEVRIYGRALSADEITALYNKECRIEFIAVKKIVFTSPEFSMTQNNPSPAILLEAQDRNGSRIASCFDTIVLGSSSPGGRFSVSSTSWADTTSVYFYEGAAVVYYIDANAGFFLLTASGEGFFEDTQVNEILVPGPNAFTSSLAFDAKRARATGSDSITAVVSIKDTFGYPVAGISVTLASARANSDVISPGFAQTTDLNGQCTFAVSSIYCGPDLLSATADGCTVSGSLLLNNSFEDGSVWPDAWTRSVPDSNYKWDNAVFRSGRMSAKVENAQLTETWTNWEQVVEVEPGAVYFLSGWLKTGTLATGAQAAFFIHHLDLNGNIMSQEWTSFVTTSNQAWQEYSLSPSVEGGCVKFRIGCSVYQPTQAGSTAWFDDVRLTGGSNIRFTASRLRIISDAFSVTKNNPSPDVIVQAGDEVGNIDTDYNNTVSLSSDSENGRFSIDRLQWSASSDSSITLSSGTATFFYKDSLAGNPELSAMSYQLSADSQSESILEPAVVETNSFIMYGSYRIGASATNKCSVIVVTNDTFGYPVGGIEVTLASARADSDVISPGPAQTTDVNGQATWTFGSIYTGDDTLSVIAEGGKLIEQGVRKDISGFWKFEEGAGLRAMDMSGRSNNASLVNDPAWAPGRLNSCLDYETNDYAAVPDAESINPGTGSITVEAWVKTTQAPAPLEGDKIIARKDTTGDPRVFWGLGMIGYDTSTLGRANFQVYKSGIGNNQVLSTGTINDGQWHLLTGIRDIAAGKIKLYVDGIFQNTGDEAFGDLTGAEPLCFGNDASFFGPASSFQGLIDEVRLYKSALAETEVIASFLGKCVVTFVPGAAGLKFISSPFTAVAGTASTPAMLEAQDPAGERVEDFSETCDLLSSAANGRFSPDGINWSTSNNTFILFSSGTGVFYYMDADTGMPVITAYRISLIADTQTENIIPPPSPSNTASFMLINSYLVPGDGASACTVVVCVLSDSGIPIPGETVTLSASRSNSTTIQPTNQPTDSNGQATFTLKSNYPGQETITASCSAEGTITRAVQRSDAAAIWGFDELGTAFTDISGNMHNGSLSGAVHSQGKFGTGLKFDGANDYATVPDSPDLRITGNITVEAWIYMDAFADTADWHNEIISKTDFNVMRFFVRQSNHRLCVSQVYGGVSGVDDGNQALSAGQWYHVAFTYDGQKFFIYVNGEQDAEFSHSGTLLTSMNPVLIGKQIDTSLFRGLIDELRIYTRALSPEEIRASYRSIANVIFTGVPERVKITSAPFSVARNNPSPEIILEIRDTTGNKYPVFNETVALASSSLTGRFSTDGLQWNTANNTSIWLSAGSGMFYYKDSVAGAPILSASRIGLSADSQSESILEPSVLETNCFIAYSAFRISADGLAACTVTVNVNDTFGSPIDGVLVTISSSRGNSDTIQPTNQLTDSNGQATWTLRSVYDGVTILTAQAQGRTISRGVRKGISGLWKFEDGSGLTAKDQSGRSNNGKLLNGPSWAFGRFNNCLQYDGTNDIVAVPNADSLNPDTGSLTVEAWVKTSQAPVPLEGDKVIARKDTTGAPRIFWGFVMGGFDTGTIGKAMFQVYNSSSGVVGITSGNTINNGAWHHLAGIRDVSAGQIRFFLDGVSQGSSNEGLGNITNSESLSFGNDASWFGPGSAFQGLIDEVKVYQAALTDSEVIASFLGNCPVMFLPAATKVEIVFPSSFSIPANAISAGINIEARNSYGMKDENFGGTCGLSSSSADGRFSADRLQWSATNETYITLSAGAGSFYYKDSSVGNVTLSAFSFQLSADTIAGTIYAPSIVLANSLYALGSSRIRADGNNACTVTITINDTFGYPVQGAEVTLASARANSDVILPGSAQTTDENGQCTWLISSGYAGLDTVAVFCGGMPVLRGIQRSGAAGIWCMDENLGAIARDISGNGNNAQFSASLPVWQAAGKTNSCLQFNGSNNQYVIVADAPSLDAAGELSLYAWVYPTAYGPNERTVMAKENTYKMDINSGGVVRFLISSQDGWVNYAMGGSVPLNQWSFVAATFDGKNKKIYVNNVEAASRPGTAPISANNEPLIIGGRQVPPDDYSTYFTGYIDEAGVYTRALNKEELKALYESRISPCFSAINLVFLTPGVKMKVGTISLQITVSAGGALGGADPTYPDTAIDLSTTSDSGSFSANYTPWVPVNSVQLSGGSAGFFYRDNAMNNPVIKVSIPSADLETGSQQETVTAAQLVFATDIFWVSNAGISPKIKVIAQGLSSETAVNFNEVVSLTSSFPTGRFSISDTPWNDVATVTFTSGQLAFYYRDKQGGIPLITVYQPELDLLASFEFYVIMPVLEVTKEMKNLGTNISGRLVAVNPGDIIECRITILNTGTESASGVVITDTVVFDTLYFSALEFISMETASGSDSWAFARDIDTNWQAWGIQPGIENVKGLRWLINTIFPGEARVVKFRVKIK